LLGALFVALLFGHRGLRGLSLGVVRRRFLLAFCRIAGCFSCQLLGCLGHGGRIGDEGALGRFVAPFVHLF